MIQQLVFPMDKPFETEAKFTMWLGRQIHQAGGFWHKISDGSVDAKPADSLFALNGIHGICEIKVGNEKTKVDVFKKLRPNQAFGLRRYKKNGGLSIVIYYSKLYHKYRVMEFEEEMLLSLVSK